MSERWACIQPILPWGTSCWHELPIPYSSCRLYCPRSLGQKWLPLLYLKITLLMVNIVDNIINNIFTWKTSEILLWVHAFYQPIGYDIRGPYCRLLYMFLGWLQCAMSYYLFNVMVFFLWSEHMRSKDGVHHQNLSSSKTSFKWYNTFKSCSFSTNR